jgi:uncharacterized protein YlxW (UPF0749 family)
VIVDSEKDMAMTSGPAPGALTRSQELAKKAQELQERRQTLSAEVETLTREMGKIDGQISRIISDVVACL